MSYVVILCMSTWVVTIYNRFEVYTFIFHVNNINQGMILSIYFLICIYL